MKTHIGFFATLLLGLGSRVAAKARHLEEEEPSAEPDIVATAVAGGFNTLVAALTATDLAGAVAAPNGPFTVCKLIITFRCLRHVRNRASNTLDFLSLCPQSLLPMMLLLPCLSLPFNCY